MAATAAGVAGVTAEAARFPSTSKLNGKAAQRGLPPPYAGALACANRAACAPRADACSRAGQHGTGHAKRAATPIRLTRFERLTDGRGLARPME